MSSDDLETSVERFGISDFFKMSVDERDYYLPTAKMKGVFGMDLHEFSLKKDIIIPSLGEIVDYVNGSEDGIHNLRAKLNKYPLVTSTCLQREGGGRWINIIEVNSVQRLKKGFPAPPKRFVSCDFSGYLNLTNSTGLGEVEKEIVEKIFNRSYASIKDALNRISLNSEKIVHIPESTIIFDDVPYHNKVLALVKSGNALIVKEYKICGGDFCLA